MSKNGKDWSQFKEQNETDSELEESTESDSAEEALLDEPSYKELQEQLTLAEQKAQDNWEKSVRSMAELDNVRRRMEREVANAHTYGTEKLLSALLPVMDSLAEATKLADKEKNGPMYEGLELTIKLFADVLQKFGIEQLDPIGQIFNPAEHEAMTMQEVPGTAPNTVIAVFQKGYKLSERVIRPARVIVSK